MSGVPLPSVPHPALSVLRNAKKNWQRIQDHFFFATFHPLRDYCLEVSTGRVDAPVSSAPALPLPSWLEADSELTFPLTCSPLTRGVLSVSMQ